VGVDPSEVRAYLEEHGWDFIEEGSGDQHRFLFSLECAGGLTLTLEISLTEEGQFVQLRVPDLLRGMNLETSPYRRRVLAAAAEETYRRRLAKVGYDPSDGEIDCCIDLPLEDLPLTRRQFEYALHILVLVARLVHRRASTILQSGRDPGPLEVEDLARPT